MEILSGLILGLLGSFHCIAMCGPIALAIPADTVSRWKFIKSRLLYNSGRIISYAFLGMVFGFLGNRINMFGMQRGLAISVGVLILLSVILTVTGGRSVMKNTFVSKVITGYKIQFSRLFKKNSRPVFLLFGIMNGFLPCGFVYIALSGAMITGDVFQGSVYMMLFGIGTVPVMLSVSLFGNYVNLNIRRKISKFNLALSVVLALLFIARGMNLGIPYISPAQSDQKNVSEELICH
ncbi:MAG TPA: sulfite exporter TauE/SafE family protein [Ignavibacteria bacterium]|nr:sulfite exporter TauE/SafE family protein [Ignavibacteria bacterium]